MTKYHLSTDGNPRVCKAADGNCPLGGSENHFTSKKGARENFEASIETEFSESTTKKPSSSGSVRTVNDRGDVVWRDSDGEPHSVGDQPAIIRKDGTKEWYQHGWPHRDGDLPAVVEPNGTKYWYQNDEVHRDGGQPAIVKANGTKYWKVNGLFHRDNDLPAIERRDGRKEWYQNDKLHRDGDKPAFTAPNGTKKWYQNDELHRDNGPAIEWNDGSKEWWVNGKFQYGVLAEGVINDPYGRRDYLTYDEWMVNGAPKYKPDLRTDLYTSEPPHAEEVAPLFLRLFRRKSKSAQRG